MMIGKLFDLTGRVAVVTGSSRGPGRAMTTISAKPGAEVLLSSLICCLALTTAAASASAGPPAGNEVTIKGMVLNNVHTGEKQTNVFVYALDGTPEISAAVDRIVAENYPDRGLDGDAARKLQDQFTAKVKYFIDGPHAEALCKNATYGARQPMALTGVIAERDGKRWITVSKYADAAIRYPAKMLAADKPWVMPNKTPLLLKINEKLLLKCIWVPRGKFFMGEPYYQCPHWQEAPPHMVTLTQGFYMAEHPITEEMFEAAVGNNPNREKWPRRRSMYLVRPCTSSAASCRRRTGGRSGCQPPPSGNMWPGWALPTRPSGRSTGTRTAAACGPWWSSPSRPTPGASTIW